MFCLKRRVFSWILFLSAFIVFPPGIEWPDHEAGNSPPINTSVNKTGSVHIKLTLRHVRITIVAVEKQEVLCSECFCNLSYAACKAHAPNHIVIFGLSGRTIVFRIMFYVQNGTIFRAKSYWTYSMYFDFLYNFCWKIFTF
jgi:hypothetical protein